MLYRLEAGDYSIHFGKEYYSELYRVFPKIKRLKNGRPSLFARITREYFYALFPGQANDIFDKYNSDRVYYNHQFLSDDGDRVFQQVMASFLTFLRCCKPGNWDSFVNQYNNAYGVAYQKEIDFDVA